MSLLKLRFQNKSDLKSCTDVTILAQFGSVPVIGLEPWIRTKGDPTPGLEFGTKGDPAPGLHPGFEPTT